jgi:hypothetical protein
MADSPAPTRDVDAASEGFRGIAKAAGKELKEVLQRDFESAAKYQGFADFDIEPYQKILKDVMKDFETQVGFTNAAHSQGYVAQTSRQVFGQRHQGGSKLEWRVIRLITKPKSFDETSYGSRPGDPWILALNVRAEENIGQSFSVKKEHSVEAGDVFLGYAVKQPEDS